MGRLFHDHARELLEAEVNKQVRGGERIQLVVFSDQHGGSTRQRAALEKRIQD